MASRNDTIASLDIDEPVPEVSIDPTLEVKLGIQ